MEEQLIQQRYELMDRICYSICEGNEYQTLRFVRERNALGLPGRLPDELTEWQYDLISQKSLIIQSLRGIGISADLLDDANTEFTRRIYSVKEVPECRIISEEMAISFCRMVSFKEIHRYSMLVQKVVEAVERDLSQPLTLQHFSQTLNVNSSYLSGLFSREVGMTLTEYVTRRRVTYAANLLLTTQLPIKTVSKMAGIQDVQYFSRIFKKRMGNTPSQYRQNMKPNSV